MNTIQCAMCGDGGAVRVTSRDDAGTAGLWTATCTACGSTWEFDG